MNLAHLITEFCKLNPHYGDPCIAWGKCDQATYSFMSFAHHNGYEEPMDAYTFYADGYFDGDLMNRVNPDPEVYTVKDADGRILRNDVGVQMCTWHSIVDAGHILIDFTARQYRTHYAFPHIVAIDETFWLSRQRAMAAKAGL